MATLKDEVRSNDATDASVGRVDMKLEIVVIPVSDVDRAKDFYGRLGWRLDADFAHGEDWRVIQRCTPLSTSISLTTPVPLWPQLRSSNRSLFSKAEESEPVLKFRTQDKEKEQ